MRKHILVSMIMAVASLLPTVVQAGGLSLYEIGTADVGLASDPAGLSTTASLNYKTRILWRWETGID